MPNQEAPAVGMDANDRVLTMVDQPLVRLCVGSVEYAQARLGGPCARTGAALRAAMPKAPRFELEPESVLAGHVFLVALPLAERVPCRGDGRAGRA